LFQLPTLNGFQVLGILKPQVAAVFKLRASLLFFAADLVDRIVDDFMIWNLSKVNWALGRCCSTPLMKSGDMSQQTSSTFLGSP